MLEDMCRDRQALRSRVGEHALVMLAEADPQAVPAVIEETEATPPPAELMAACGAQVDRLTVDRLRAAGQTPTTGQPGK